MTSGEFGCECISRDEPDPQVSVAWTGNSVAEEKAALVRTTA